MVYWGNHKLLMKNFHNDAYWERIKIGAGPTPIKTDEGWLMIYHGVQATCNAWTYSIGVALLDLDDPSIVSADKDNIAKTCAEWQATWEVLKHFFIITLVIPSVQKQTV